MVASEPQSPQAEGQLNRIASRCTSLYPYCIAAEQSNPCQLAHTNPELSIKSGLSAHCCRAVLCGPKVGIAEGVGDKDNVLGYSVGENEGIKVGILVGENEGIKVGILVGVVVGSKVGKEVGKEVDEEGANVVDSIDLS